MLLLALLISALRLKSFSSMEINCSATSTRDGTFYNVPDFGDHRCDYHWINNSNQTVANTDEKMDDLVVASNITSLQTHKCYERIEYVLDCYPKAKKNARCVTNCSQIAGVSRKLGTKYRWIAPVISAALCLLVVGILCYRHLHPEVKECNIHTGVDHIRESAAR
ncbi:hypothetical protein AMECASPLE_019338 [Ameca splendens]|uniref:Uncharacterized protein n=1 Tax=Ameca splendens TaxID=208324 RepID=A0ABV0Z276_9TELE